MRILCNVLAKIKLACFEIIRVVSVSRIQGMFKFPPGEFLDEVTSVETAYSTSEMTCKRQLTATDKLQNIYTGSANAELMTSENARRA